MSRKQKAKCDKIVNSILNEVGVRIPEEVQVNSATSGSGSGTDSDDGKSSISRKQKVKSGAKVKKRPVIKTELWPHTIANENDGEEVSCENISLVKFLNCFSYILVTCGDRAETDGRAVLLHAITSVFEYLQWPDVRIFHNLIMTKIEQGRLDWSTDFTVLGTQFVDKKVRQSARQRGSTATRGSSSGQGNKGYGKTFGGNDNRFRQYSNRFSSNRNQYNSSLVCRLWNAGNCSFGADCKRWHCCLTCFDASKVEETSHKAADCGNQAQRNRPR